MRQRANDVAIIPKIISLSVSDLFACLPERVVVGSGILHGLLTHTNIRIPNPWPSGAVFKVVFPPKSCEVVRTPIGRPEFQQRAVVLRQIDTKLLLHYVSITQIEDIFAKCHKLKSDKGSKMLTCRLKTYECSIS